MQNVAFGTLWFRRGGAENARLEKAGRSKMQGWKTRDWKTLHQTAGLENARMENAVPDCRGGKRETKTAGVENTGKGVYGQPHVAVYVNCCSNLTHVADKWYRLSAKKVMLLSSVN